MSSTLWGPALQAEVDYRREQLTVARSPRRERRRPALHRTRAVKHRDSRGWALPGSGAWHAAQ
ncbi:hypothetical protein ICW40_11475 [Actinotalea ferrariae]|uniref:hypothetical protein n=1 Tax=Actinotalea ferrariae TaxID=1386098 RepID=UPI001C8C80D7|nr:hypothetical protein [Actinotalea ferrariae]MBX9245425.1 hypothetical protein [Actinotalea ferrariae]